MYFRQAVREDLSDGRYLKKNMKEKRNYLVLIWEKNIPSRGSGTCLQRSGRGGKPSNGDTASKIKSGEETARERAVFQEAAVVRRI